jgi:signal transduction histidine kinase
MRLNLLRRRFVQRWWGLTSQLFLFVVLPLATLLVVVSLGSLTLHGDAMRDLVSERDERAVRAASAAITEQLNHRAAAVRGLAAHAATAGSPDEALTDYAFLLPDFEGGLALYAPNGALLAASSAPELWQARPVANPLRATHLTPGSAPQFSPTFTDPGSDELLILVAASASSGPSPGPIAVGAFSPASLARRALGEGLSTDHSPFTVLVDVEGRGLYQTGASPTTGLDITQHPGVAEALRGESGGAHHFVQGSEHVVAFSPVSPVGWALVMEEPWEAVDNPLLRRTQAAPLVLIPILLFALVALGFGLRQIVQPLRTLEQQASQLAWGHFEAIEKPVGGIAEIRRLQAELIRMTQKVKAAQQSLRGYINTITVGQEDERRRLARELHDGAVQALVALDQRAQLAQMTVKDGPPKAAEQLAEVRRMAASLIEEVRRVIRALRPIYLEDLGLLPALEMLARDLEQTSGARVTFATTGPPRRLPPGHEIAIFRIVQEALNNVARYASAQSVDVSAAFHASEFNIRVQDDGKGFAAPERVSDLAAAGHYGLMGMQERAELIGARLTLQSAPGSGTTVELRVPL